MPCGLRILQHPSLDILCREDGAILTKFGWNFGTKNSRGYLTIHICNKTYTIHKLIAETFIPNPHNKPTVDHKDRDKTNNFYTNLRWATVSEQIANRSNIDTEIKLYGVRRCDDRRKYERAWKARRRMLRKLILI